MTQSIHLTVAGDEDVEYVRYRRTTHRKGLPGLTLCGLSSSEFAGMMPSTNEKYNCKSCKAEEPGEPHPGWTEVRPGYRWERTDGAVVMWDQRSPYPNPENPTSKLWTAWEPDPSQKALSMERGRPRRTTEGELAYLSFPRRWKTAEAAMKAVDQEYPLLTSVEA